jgi:hypothetical protein
MRSGFCVHNHLSMMQHWVASEEKSKQAITLSAGPKSSSPKRSSNGSR